MASQIPIGSDYLGGAITVNVFAALSAFGLLTILIRTIFLSIRYRLLGRGPVPTECAFFSTNFGCYAACLLIATMFNTVAGLISVKWTVMGAIADGGVCKLQVAIMQLGNWSTAYFTVAIAIHTFNSLVLRLRQMAVIRMVTMVVGWAAAFIAAAVPVAIRPSRYGPAGVTCDFTPDFSREKFVLHVLPILISSLLSSGVYSVIFLILRGTLSIDGGIKFTIDPTERWSVAGKESESYRNFVAKIAGVMLCFPIAYVALLVPYSIFQLLVISGFNVPFVVMVLSFVLWFLLGIVNVLLMYNIFRVLGRVMGSPALSKRTEASIFPMQRESKLFDTQVNPHILDGDRTISWASSGSEYSLPSDYGEIIRQSMGYGKVCRPMISRSNLSPQDLPNASRTNGTPTSEGQFLTYLASQQALSPPLRPSRPATPSLLPNTALAVTTRTIERPSQANRKSSTTRPALSAVASKRSRILLESQNPPSGNYI